MEDPVGGVDPGAEPSSIAGSEVQPPENADLCLSEEETQGHARSLNILKYFGVFLNRGFLDETVRVGP